MARYVNGHKAEVLIDKALDSFVVKEEEVLFDAISKASKKAKKDLQNVQDPRKYGDYAKGWAIRTKREKFGINSLIYNRLYPGLTHLLEKGHITRNQYGQYQRTPAHKHIQPARDNAVDYLIDELTKNL